MIKNIAQRSAPIAALAMGLGLAGCSYSVDWGEVDGVPLSEFDQSGDAPTEVALAGSDQVVITEGVQKVRPGVAVKPVFQDGKDKG